MRMGWRLALTRRDQRREIRTLAAHIRLQVPLLPKLPCPVRVRRGRLVLVTRLERHPAHDRRALSNAPVTLFVTISPPDK